MLNETGVKAIMAAILLTQLDIPEDQPDVCLMDVAASLAEDLYAHVAVGSCNTEEDDPNALTWYSQAGPSDKGN